MLDVTISVWFKWKDGPTQGGVSPCPGKLDSQAGAASSSSRYGGAVEEAVVRGGSLSNDEASSKGKNGEWGGGTWYGLQGQGALGSMYKDDWCEC